MFQNDKVSLPVGGSSAEAHVVVSDDGAKPPSNSQSLDVSNDSSNDLTITNESSVAPRPAASETDHGSVSKPSEPSAAGAAAKAGDIQSVIDLGVGELSSQESSVTRTRSRDVMDFEHLKMKLVELTGPSKDATGAASTTPAAAKTKHETEEVKDTSAVDAVNVTATTASQVSVGRHPNQAADSHRGPSLSPEPNTVPPAPIQQATQAEPAATKVVQRDAVSYAPAPSADVAGGHPAAPTVLTANGELAPVQPVKPVPVYPVSVTATQPVPQQKPGVGPPGQVNGSAMVPQMLPAGVMAPDVQPAVVLQPQQVVDDSAGFVPVQPNVMPDLSSSPASPDSVNQVYPQQPTTADYTQASLLALYNQMMMPLPLMAPAWPAVGLNPYLVATNPLMAAQMMYGAPLLTEPMAAADPHIGIPGYPQVQPPAVPGHIDHLVMDAALRPAAGIAPLPPVHPAGIPLTSTMPPLSAAAARPLAPRVPAAVSGSDQHLASQQRKRPDLAILEQALIEKLHGPRKPMPAVNPGRAVHSPAAQSLPSTMSWFPLPYGQPMQHIMHTPTVPSTVTSPLFSADLQQPGSAPVIAADATSVTASPSSSGVSVATTVVHSGRTTPPVVTAVDPVSVIGRPLSTQTELLEAAPTSNAEEKATMDPLSSTSSAASKRKLQFTTTAVKDDHFAANNQQEFETSVPRNVTVDAAQLTPNSASAPPEPSPVASVKAPVKKGRFRVTDVKECAEAISQLEGGNSQLPQESTCNNISVTTASLTAPELNVQQVRKFSCSFFSRFVKFLW